MENNQCCILYFGDFVVHLQMRYKQNNGNSI